MSKWKSGLFGILIVAMMLSGCQLSQMKNQQKSEFMTKQFFAMDTYMNIDLYYDTNGSVEEQEHMADVLEEAVHRIQKLDEILSTGNENSEVSQLNAYFQDIELKETLNPQLETESNENMNPQSEEYSVDSVTALRARTVSGDTATLIKNSLEITKKTGGAFDISIYPVMKCWGFADGNYKVPDASELEECLLKVDALKIVYDEEKRTVFLPNQMEIDFGGIAKGYASETIAKYFKEQEVTSALLNLGGNVQAIGAKPDGSDWKIGVKNPINPKELMCSVAIKDQTVITSGGYERYFEENGKKYHHIIEPKTGYPSESGLISVSIISSNGMLADAYSTALFVMGEKRAIDFWKKNAEDFDFILVTTDGKMLISEGLENRIHTQMKYEVIRVE